MKVGRYTLLHKIAQGGMGEVYVASQEGLGSYSKQVALKLLLPHLSESPTAVQMFLDEARIAARMSHRNVVQLFDLGEHEGRYFLAMELVDGMSLARLLKGLREAEETLDEEEICFIGRMLGEALHHAHELRGSDGDPLNIVHRDVSPQNVLVSREGDIKLTDFGIAKVRGALSHTRTGELRGKCEYFAPEQFAGAALDRRVDVFAAGVTLFQLATLQSPFRRESEAATMKAVFMDPLPALGTLRPDLSPALSAALEAATRKDVAARLPDALALRDALPPPADEAACRASLGARLQRLGERFQTEAERTHLTRASGWTADLVTAKERPSSKTEERVTSRERPRWKSGGRSSTRRRWVLGGAAALLVVLCAAAAVVISQASPGAPPHTAVAPAVVLPVASAPEALPTSTETGSLPVNTASGSEGREPEAPRPVPKEHADPRGPDAAAAPVTNSAATRVPTKRATRKAAYRPPSPAVKKAPAEIGYLTLEALPWAEVEVAGKSIGQTPLHRVALPAGKVQLVFKNPETTKRKSRTLEIRPGKESRLMVDLR